MSSLLNWVGRIVLFYIFRAALYLMFPGWRMEIRAVMYAVIALWIYNEFPALRRPVRKWLRVEPDESYDKDNWVELKDFAALVVGVMVVLVGATVGQTFFEDVSLIGMLQIFGFLITASLFLRYGWAVLRGKRFYKVEDADKQQPVEDTDEQQP